MTSALLPVPLESADASSQLRPLMTRRLRAASGYSVASLHHKQMVSSFCMARWRNELQWDLAASSQLRQLMTPVGRYSVASLRQRTLGTTSFRVLLYCGRLPRAGCDPPMGTLLLPCARDKFQ